MIKIIMVMMNTRTTTTLILNDSDADDDDDDAIRDDYDDDKATILKMTLTTMAMMTMGWNGQRKGTVLASLLT